MVRMSIVPVYETSRRENVLEREFSWDRERSIERCSVCE